jgi:GNAT superfamily N-acetyltransferase
VGIEIRDEGPEALAAYASISISFPVVEVLDADALSVASPRPFAARPVAVPEVKDYDAHPGNDPLDWPARFDIARWGFLMARIDGQHVGGAVVVACAPELDMLEGRDDLAVLWDTRVAATSRRQGVGTALLAAVDTWARARGSRVLKAETQNVNLPACHFYAARGFTLGAVNRGAYPELPGEIQLLWYKTLDARGGPG